jgi:hypothetical protein
LAKKRNHVWQPTAKIMALLLPLEAEAIQVPAAAALLALGSQAGRLGRARGARSARTAPPGRVARAGFQDESTPHYNTQQPTIGLVV